VLAAAFAAALACAATAFAGSNTYKLRISPEGTAAARAALLTKSDLGSAWTGGPVKPSAFKPEVCANYHPKYSDLVLTGSAAAVFKQPGLYVRSEAGVLQTAKMVERDWARSIASRNYLACERTVGKRRSTPKEKFVAIRQIRIPAIGTHSALFRLITDVKTKTGTVRVASDVMLIGQGSSELTLMTVMPLASVPLLFPNELVLAKTMLRRVRV